MTSKYIYKGMDLTLDIYEKLRHVVELVAAQNKISFDEAYMLFAKSHIFLLLQIGAIARWSLFWSGLLRARLLPKIQ